MIFYGTDRKGEQYEAHITSEVVEVDARTFADQNPMTEKYVVHRVEIIAKIGEFSYASNPSDDPASTLSNIYEEIERRVNRVPNNGASGRIA